MTDPPTQTQSNTYKVSKVAGGLRFANSEEDEVFDPAPRYKEARPSQDPAL